MAPTARRLFDQNFELFRILVLDFILPLESPVNAKAYFCKLCKDIIYAHCKVYNRSPLKHSALVKLEDVFLQQGQDAEEARVAFCKATGWTGSQNKRSITSKMMLPDLIIPKSRTEKNLHGCNLPVETVARKSAKGATSSTRNEDIRVNEPIMPFELFRPKRPEGAEAKRT